MERIIRQGLLFSSLLISWPIITAAGQSTVKPTVAPAGVITTSTDLIRVNDTAVRRGSTVFNGSEIQTGDAAAFVSLSSGGGVLSIAPESRVKVSREPSQVIARLLRGTVTLRSRLASTVFAPDRVISSEADNLYTVSISESGTRVESFLKPVTVKAADGAVRSIATGTTEAVAIFDEKSDSEEREPVTHVSATFVTVNCQVSDTRLSISGVVICRSVPVRGAVVRIRLQAGDDVSTETTRTDEAGRYRLTLTDDSLLSGGTVQVTTMVNRQGCGRAQNTCTF